MGANRFFWPQELLDEWIVDEKITLKGNQLTLLEEHRTYAVSQAFYFSRYVGDGADKYQLVGRVKELSTLEGMGAEHYMDSVLIEDSAYQVVPGFTGQPIAAVETDNAASDLSTAITHHAGDEDGVDDQELLARFLIENL
ncbi:MAG: hypothetical protein QNJ97_17460 [Myxococcota bacterium]|nr:hypothetical protein [Myxococcota bacterium]